MSVRCRPGGAIRLDNVQPVTDALRQGTKLMESAASGEKLSPADRETAERVFVWPVVAQVGDFSSSCITCSHYHGSAVSLRHSSANFYERQTLLDTDATKESSGRLVLLTDYGSSSNSEGQSSSMYSVILHCAVPRQDKKNTALGWQTIRARPNA